MQWLAQFLKIGLPFFKNQFSLILLDQIHFVDEAKDLGIR